MLDEQVTYASRPDGLATTQDERQAWLRARVEYAYHAIKPCGLQRSGEWEVPLLIVRRPGLVDISSVVPWEAGHELRSQSRPLRLRWPACALLGWILTRHSGLSAGQKTLGQ